MAKKRKYQSAEEGQRNDRIFNLHINDYHGVSVIESKGKETEKQNKLGYVKVTSIAENLRD